MALFRLVYYSRRRLDQTRQSDLAQITDILEVAVHNNQRDGLHRQAIARGRVAYEPNSLGGGCPFQSGARGFVAFPQPQEGDKVRGKPEKFAEHYLQATLFWKSQSDIEKLHIIRAFRFELSRVQVAPVRERVIAQLLNVAPELAQAVADGLGIVDLPDPLPKALEDYGTKVVGWNSDSIIDAIESPDNTFENPDGTPREPVHAGKKVVC